jgi:hypothetical protein
MRALLLILVCLSAQADDGLFAEAKAAVTATLRDPASATFDGLFLGRVNPRTGIPAVCGRVNAKNGYGGYAGPVKFYYAGWTKTSGVANSPEGKIVYESLCEKK